MTKVVIVIFVQVKYNPLQHHALVVMQTFAQRPIFAKVTIKSQQVLIQCRMNETSTASKKKNFFFVSSWCFILCIWYVCILVLRCSATLPEYKKDSYHTNLVAAMVITTDWRASLKNAFFKAPYWLEHVEPYCGKICFSFSLELQWITRSSTFTNFQLLHTVGVALATLNDSIVRAAVYDYNDEDAAADDDDYQ